MCVIVGSCDRVCVHEQMHVLILYISICLGFSMYVQISEHLEIMLKCESVRKIYMCVCVFVCVNLTRSMCI